MSTTDGFRADWAKKDFYAELGVKKDASADEIKKAYRKLARANHPDSNPGDTAKHDKFKSVAEAYDVVGDPEKRAQVRRDARALRLRWLPRRLRRRVRRRRRAASTSTTCCASDRRRGRRLRRHVRRPLRRRRPQPAAAAAPAEGRRRRDHRDDQLHRRHRGRHDLAAADLRRALPGLLRHRRQARHQAAHLPRVRGRRLRRRLRRRRVLDERDLPGLRRPPARLRRAVPDLPRQRPRHVRALHPGPHPRRGEGRPADPAARQGRGRRERRTGRRPLRHRQGDRRTGCSAARATT